MNLLNDLTKLRDKSGFAGTLAGKNNPRLYFFKRTLTGKSFLPSALHGCRSISLPQIARER